MSDEGEGQVNATVRPDVFSVGIVRRLVAMQMERLIWQRKWMDRMQSYMPPRKITRMERAKWWINSRRVDLAKWIAGDNWPDEA